MICIIFNYYYFRDNNFIYFFRYMYVCKIIVLEKMIFFGILGLQRNMYVYGFNGDLFFYNSIFLQEFYYCKYFFKGKI